MTKEQLKKSIANIIGCPVEEITGNVGKVLTDIENSYGEVVIYWGCISDNLLKEDF